MRDTSIDLVNYNMKCVFCSHNRDSGLRVGCSWSSLSVSLNGLSLLNVIVKGFTEKKAADNSENAVDANHNFLSVLSHF